MLTFLRERQSAAAHAAAKTRVFKDIKMKSSWGSFLEALERDGMYEPEMQSRRLDEGYLWANDIDGTGGIRLTTSQHPLLSKGLIETLTVSGSKNKLDIFENTLKRYAQIGEEIEPKDVKLRVDYHDKLNPDFWTDDEVPSLKPEVEQKLRAIADEFLATLKMPEMEIVDIIITGSNANYNWTEGSDIDLHIVVDFQQARKKYGPLVEEYFEAKRRLWNNTHDITLKGQPVELYVQDEDEVHIATGVYSLKNEEWLVIPKYKEPKWDHMDVRMKAAKFMNQIDELVDNGACKPAAVDVLKKKIIDYRKAGLKDAGEFSVENLVFKTLRNSGYLEKLSNCQLAGVDKSLSIEDEEWWNK